MKVSPKRRVKPGKHVTYGVRFRSTSPTNALTSLRVQVTLPPYFDVVSSTTSPLPQRRNKGSRAGVVSGGTVSWNNMTIVARKYRSFRIKVHVALTFGATLAQTNASPNGDPYCPMAIKDATVRPVPANVSECVRGAARWAGVHIWPLSDELTYPVCPLSPNTHLSIHQRSL